MSSENPRNCIGLRVAALCASGCRPPAKSALASNADGQYNYLENVTQVRYFLRVEGHEEGAQGAGIFTSHIEIRRNRVDVSLSPFADHQELP